MFLLLLLLIAMLPQKGEKDAIDLKGGLLLKRKDFLGVDEKAGAHPNRTYYFKKNADDLNKVIQTSSSALQVTVTIELSNTVLCDH